MGQKSYKDLRVWQKALDFADAVYVVTRLFPKEELYGLTSQIRRSLVSVPSNIAEGCARNTFKENNQFLGIAAGSLAEVDTQLRLALRFNYLDVATFETLQSALEEISRMLSGLKKSLKKPSLPVLTTHN
jgi:four helix bundle protein